MGGTLLNLVRKIPKPKPASMIIYEQLVNAIVSGEVKEGQRIVESDLTKRSIGLWHGWRKKIKSGGFYPLRTEENRRRPY